MFESLSVMRSPEMQPWVRWGLLAVFIAGFLAFLPYQVLDGPSAHRLADMQSELERARAEIDALVDENRQLLSDVRALKDNPQVIFDMARTELGMVFPNDLVVRMENRP